MTIGQLQRTEISFKFIFLLAIKIYLKLFHILSRTERGLAVGRLKIITIHSNIPQEIYSKFLGRFPSDISLIIEKSRVILSLSIHCGK